MILLLMSNLVPTASFRYFAKIALGMRLAGEILDLSPTGKTI